MRLLLDTHTLLWSLTDVSRLSKKAKQLIEDGENDILVSAASAFEIALKTQLGKLRLPAKPSTFISEQMLQKDFRPLSITANHALYVFELPALHRDPFDRLLIAQSHLEQLPIITSDALISQYAIKTIW
jgi:PIN domain nuclease of toxin-antitoxin system